MSEPTAHPQQESDLRSIRKLTIIGGIIVAIVVVMSACAAGIVWWRTGRFFTPDIPAPDPEVVKRTVLEQQMFDLEAAGLEQRSMEHAHLHSYGWVDRDRNVAHIPIQEAMQMTLRRLRSRPESTSENQEGGP